MSVRMSTYSVRLSKPSSWLRVSSNPMTFVDVGLNVFVGFFVFEAGLSEPWGFMV